MPTYTVKFPTGAEYDVESQDDLTDVQAYQYANVQRRNEISGELAKVRAEKRATTASEFLHPTLPESSKTPSEPFVPTLSEGPGLLLSPEETVRTFEEPFQEIPKPHVNPDDSFTGAAAKTLVGMGVGVAEFAESPLGLGAAAAGTVARPVVTGGFALQSLGQLARVASETIPNWQALTPAQKGVAGAQIVGSALMAAGLGKASFSEAMKFFRENPDVLRYKAQPPSGYKPSNVQTPLAPAGGTAQPSSVPGQLVSPLFAPDPMDVAAKATADRVMAEAEAKVATQIEEIPRTPLEPEPPPQPEVPRGTIPEPAPERAPEPPAASLETPTEPVAAAAPTGEVRTGQAGVAAPEERPVSATTTTSSEVSQTPDIRQRLYQEGLYEDDVTDLLAGKITVAQAVDRRLAVNPLPGTSARPTTPDHIAAVQEARANAIERISKIVPDAKTGNEPAPFAVAPIVGDMMATMFKATSELRSQVSNVRLGKPGEILFEFQGKTYSAPEPTDVMPATSTRGTNAEASRSWALKQVLDKKAKIVTEAKTEPVSSWKKVPSVTGGGKAFFWNAYDADGRRIGSAVWDRVDKKWAAHIGDKTVGLFDSPDKAKSEVERQLSKPAAPAAQPQEANASSQQQATAVYGNVRAQPVEGAGQVPVAQGSHGVQPQTSGGIPPPSGGTATGQVTPAAIQPPTPSATTLGITPSGFGSLSVPMQRVWRGIQNIVRGIPALIRSGSARKAFDQLFDAADNKARIFGQQAAKELRVASTRLDREAAMVMVESGFSPSMLNRFERQATGPGPGVANAQALSAVNHARANWTALEPLARRVKALLDEERANERANGIDVDYHANYVPHLYDQDLWSGRTAAFRIGRSGTGLASGFKKGRTFNTIFDAIEAGYDPKTMDVSELVEHRIRTGQKLVLRKQWGDALRGIADPTDSHPIVTKLIHKTRPSGKGYDVAPPGYEVREIIPGVRVAVHQGYTSLFDALTGTSRVSGSIPGQVALTVAGGIKHGLLAFDTFHASRILQKELLLTGHVGWKKGQTLLEYSDEGLAKAEATGLITPEMSAWVKAKRPDAKLLLDNGLNVGRIQEFIHEAEQFVRNIPGIGTFNKWVFDKLTRGAMMESGLIELERMRVKRPDLTDVQRARMVARDLNAYFGNLGHQGLLKSGTAMDMARLIGLAPGWVEGMARTEAKGALQLAKGATIDPILHRTLVTGTLGRAVGQGLLAYFIGTQLLNLATRKKFTWENEEEGHKLDAWIPDVTGKTKGFFLSPFSVVAELTHDMIRYTHTEGTKLKAATKILSNKMSPLMRAGKILLGGTDYTGQNLPETWDRVKAAAWALAPTPIPVSPLIKGEQPQGQLQRQLTASMGIKTEPAQTADQQIHFKARQWMKNEGLPVEESSRTKGVGYSDLRYALRNNNMDDAAKALDVLRKTKTDAQILTTARTYALAPITGNSANDRKFIRTLTPQEKKLIPEMRKERLALRAKMVELIKSHPRVKP